jgi:tetratricopeptide (TPR) repeat protein
MEPKDKWAVRISAAALIVSLVALSVSTWQAWREAERGARMQLTDVLSKAAATRIERMKVAHDPALSTDSKYREDLTGALDDQQDFLLQQAAYLIDQVKVLTNSVEMSDLAYYFSDRGDVIEAETFYKRAVELAPAGHYALIAAENYAEFIFGQHRADDGRKEFDAAISSINAPTNDQDRWDRAWAYRKWGWFEKNVATSPTYAQERFESAKDECNHIVDSDWKQNCVNQLTSEMGSPSAAVAPSPAQQQVAQ